MADKKPKYIFDLTRLKAGERRAFSKDVGSVNDEDGADEPLLKWIGRTGVNLPEGYDWTDPKSVLDKMDLVQYLTIISDFTGSFRGLL
jgi:hypothetical protein